MQGSDDNALGDKRKRAHRLRPPKAEAIQVLQAAFAQYSRLGALEGTGKDVAVVFKGWSDTFQGRVRFHNELMRCCRLSLQTLSKKRAQYFKNYKLEVNLARHYQSFFLVKA